MGSVDLAHAAAAEARVDTIVADQAADEPVADVRDDVGGVAEGRLCVRAEVIRIVRGHRQRVGAAIVAHTPDGAKPARIQKPSGRLSYQPVAESSSAASHRARRSLPDTWVTDYPEHIGRTTVPCARRAAAPAQNWTQPSTSSLLAATGPERT